MKLTATRSIEPLAASVTITFDEEDLTRAFVDPKDPDEQLFYDLFSKAFLVKTEAEQLDILSRVAGLAAIATKLNLGVSAPQPKEK